MVRLLIVSFLALAVCWSVSADIDLSLFPDASLYVINKKDCVFPFTYNGQPYNDCTNDGNNGVIPWCSLTAEYKGMFVYCYDFHHTNLTCQSTYTVNKKPYNGCAYWSASAKYRQCKTLDDNHPNLYCPDAMNATSKTLPHRRRECDAGYKALSPDHTMCFAPSDFAIQVPITDDEKQQILDKHNEYRAAVSSEHMFQLYWDDELSKLAQARGDMCAFDHDMAINRMSKVYGWKNGQNMIMSSEIRNSLANLIDMMLSAEKENFRYGVGCDPVGTCLHYTQAMLSNVTRVGCGHTQCVYPHGIERFLTCNYLQSQYSSTYMRPYIESATPASGCPAKAQNGLCDCGNKYCQYDQGEQLDPNTCKCIKMKRKRSLTKRAAFNGAVGESRKGLIAIAKRDTGASGTRRGLIALAKRQVPGSARQKREAQVFIKEGSLDD